jgi:hypothetical protein
MAPYLQQRREETGVKSARSHLPLHKRREAVPHFLQDSRREVHGGGHAAPEGCRPTFTGMCLRWGYSLQAYESHTTPPSSET